MKAIAADLMYLVAHDGAPMNRDTNAAGSISNNTTAPNSSSACDDVSVAATAGGSLSAANRRTRVTSARFVSNDNKTPRDNAVGRNSATIDSQSIELQPSNPRFMKRSSSRYVKRRSVAVFEENG